MNINNIYGASEYLIEFCGYTQDQLNKLPADSILSFAREYYNMHLLFNSTQ